MKYVKKVEKTIRPSDVYGVMKIVEEALSWGEEITSGPPALNPRGYFINPRGYFIVDFRPPNPGEKYLTKAIIPTLQTANDNFFIDNHEPRFVVQKAIALNDAWE